MAKQSSRWRALMALLRPDALRWVGLGLLLGVVSSLVLAGPLVVRRIVDKAAAGTDSGHIVQLALVYLVIAFAAQLISVLVTWLATVSAWHTTNALRLQLAGHVLGLDHEFHRSHTPGEMIQRIDGDVTSVSDFLGKVVPKAVGAFLMVVGMVVVIGIVDWRLAVGASVYIVAAVAFVVRGRHRAVGESADEMGASARLYGGIEERLTASEDLRANGAGAHVMWRFMEESADVMSAAVRRQSAFMRLWWGVDGSVASGSALTLIASAILVKNGTISLGTAFLLFQYVLLLSRPLEDVVDQLETVQKANGAMVRVIDLLAVTSTIVDSGTLSPPVGACAVQFQDVSFQYGDDHNVLTSISLTVPAGSSIGVVGRSGSGKTTLSRLVLRLIEPSQGQVLVGGIALRDIPLQELRRRVAMVPQEVELFSGSVRDNVTLFDQQPSDDQVIDALVQVGLAELAEAGIHRQLGPSGAGLSAGEAQLVAMARVWLRSPDVVVLDEATARVDPATERRLEQAVARLIRGRTTLIIAHRLSTLDAVDYIVVMDHGRIIEQGRRSDLINDDRGHFQQLLELASGSAR